MFKIACLTFAAILGGATLAQAQTYGNTTYHSGPGGFQGTSTTYGNTTYHNGPGGFQGTSTHYRR